MVALVPHCTSRPSSMPKLPLTPVPPPPSIVEYWTVSWSPNPSVRMAEPWKPLIPARNQRNVFPEPWSDWTIPSTVSSVNVTPVVCCRTEQRPLEELVVLDRPARDVREREVLVEVVGRTRGRGPDRAVEEVESPRRWPRSRSRPRRWSRPTSPCARGSRSSRSRCRGRRDRSSRRVPPGRPRARTCPAR